MRLKREKKTFKLFIPFEICRGILNFYNSVCCTFARDVFWPKTQKQYAWFSS